jgi:hypothetical protein
MRNILLGAALSAGVIFSVPIQQASAQTPTQTCNYPAVSCPAPNVTEPPTPQTDRDPLTAQSTPKNGGLAFTGADIAQITGVGIVAIGLGGLLVIRSRRRKDAVPPTH